MNGDPATLLRTAAQLTQLARTTTAAAATTGNVRLEGWTGLGKNAFTAARTVLESDIRALHEAQSAAALVIEGYAGELASINERAAAATQKLRALQSADTIADGPTRLAATIELFAAVGAQQAAAARAAAALDAILDDPAHAAIGKATGDDIYASGPGKRVAPGILDDANFDSDDLNQGQYNDCFLIAQVLSLMQTDGGDDFLRKHISWDEDKSGYWVTIYRDGEPKRVFVDKVFEQGATDDSGEPGVAALYEAAVAKEYGTRFLDTGYNDEAMRIITGKEPRTTGGWWLWETPVSDAQHALDNGGQAVISSPRTETPTIKTEVRDDHGNTHEATVSVVAKHSYVVQQIDDDGGMWLRNPWGTGDASTDGANAFYVPAEYVKEHFGDVTFTNVTEKK